MTKQIAPITSDGLHPRLAQGIDKVLSVQRPVVLAHIRAIRSSKPGASPAQIIAILERRYLTAVTGGGALVGASSAIPAVAPRLPSTWNGTRKLSMMRRHRVSASPG